MWEKTKQKKHYLQYTYSMYLVPLFVSLLLYWHCIAAIPFALADPPVSLSILYTLAPYLFLDFPTPPMGLWPPIIIFQGHVGGMSEILRLPLCLVLQTSHPPLGTQKISCLPHHPLQSNLAICILVGP